MVYLRDPMELIAELFVNPQIMFKYRSHIHFRYYNKSNNPIISPVHADLMTSEWCRKTEDLIIKKSVGGNILLSIFNSDGAQLGANINNKTTPLMCTTGNFSDDLIDQDISKCVIGYLPDLKDYKANIWNHLKRIYRSESAVIEQIQLFDRLVERECWNEIIKCVSKHWESGVKLMVLGQGIKLFSRASHSLLAMSLNNEDNLVYRKGIAFTLAYIVPTLQEMVYIIMLCIVEGTMRI